MKSKRQANRASWRIAREVFVAETYEEAKQEALNGVLRRDFEQYFYKLLTKTHQLGLYKNDPDMTDSEVTVEYVMENVWIIGDPEQVAQKVTDLYKEVGGFGTLLAMGHEWDPEGKWERSMSLLAEQVIPMVESSI